MKTITIPAHARVTYYITKHIFESKNDEDQIQFDVYKDAQLFVEVCVYAYNTAQTQLKLIFHAKEAGAFVRCSFFAQTTGKSTIALSTVQYHNAPHTTSQLIVKGGAFDSSYIAHTGAVFIAHNAPHVSAQQTAKIILMGPEARAYTKPDLEVLNNNVTCSHGSAVGTLDQEQIFFCQARGFSLSDSKTILYKAFFQH